MPLTVYEKNNVKGGMNAVIKGTVKFNVLNQPRTPKSTKQVPNPKPEYTIELVNPQFKGDSELVNALKETTYQKDENDEVKISLRDKSPYAPTIFSLNKESKTGDELIPEGKALKEGQPVIVHVNTFDTPMNVGCSFDSLMLSTDFDHLQLQSVSSVNPDVFDSFVEEDSADWSAE